MHELDKTLEALKPCPFCGGEAERRENSLTGLLSMAQCRQCGATAFDVKWNRRAATTSVGEAELEMIASEARRYASFYPTGFAAHNSFVDFAEWIERLSASSTSAGLTEEQVEEAARAAYHAAPRNKPFEQLSAFKRSMALKEARAALEASRVAPVSQKEEVPVGELLDELEYLRSADRALEQAGEKLISTKFSSVRSVIRDVIALLERTPTPAPAGEPVGIKALEWEERGSAHYADTALGECIIDEAGDGFYVIENGRKHSEFASADAARAFMQKKHDMCVGDWLHPSPTPVSAPVGESSPVPTHECRFSIGQPVHLASPYPEMDPHAVFYVTGISWEHRMVPAHGWNIMVAGKEDIEKGYGQTDGYRPDDLLPARSPAVEGK